MKEWAKHLKLWAPLAALGIAAAVFAATASAATQPWYTQKFSWGTFKLSQRTIDKLAKGEAINVMLSMEGKTIPVYGPQYQYGFAEGLKVAQKQYGIKMKGTVTGPASSTESTADQINYIRSGLAANQIDCLTVEGGSQKAFIPVVNQAIAQGIPVWTTGTDIVGSRRFSTFHTDWVQEGGIAAQTVVDFFKKKGIALKEVAMTTGVIDQQWAQDRLNGFYDTMKKIAPEVKIDNTSKTALNTGLDPAQVYSQVKAFLQGHPGVQAIYQTDISGETVDKAVKDLGRKGKTFVAGHNVSLGNLAAIKEGVQIVTLDQNYRAQSQYAAVACAAFLTQGKIFPNSNVPVAITAENVDEQRAIFIKTTQPKR